MHRCAWSDSFVCSLTRVLLASICWRSGGAVGRGAVQVAHQFLDLAEKVAFEVSAEPHHDAVRPVPLAEVVEERLTIGGADRFLAAEHHPAERLVSEQLLFVDVVDEIARRVEVHVHLLDDHALLALDLLGLELRVAQHVDEDVQRDLPRLARAADVVARVLLAREGVELAADRVHLGRDVARGRAAFRPLEHHVLGEVGDPVRLPGLVAGAGRDHDEARDRLRVRQRRRQDAQAVREGVALVGAHSESSLRQPSGRGRDWFFS